MKNRCAYCHGSRFRLIPIRTNGRSVGRCLACGLVQALPMPSVRDVAALYADDWEHFTPYRSQEEAHRQYFERLLDAIVGWVCHDRKRRLRLLDIGCATGVLLHVAKRKGMDAVGVDVSRDAISYCRKKDLSAYYGTIQSVAKSHPWRTHFDIVIACQVIEHERDAESFFQTVQSVMKSGGVLVVATPNYDSLWRKLMGSAWIGWKHPEHLVFYTPKTLSAVLEKAGFSIVSVRQDTARGYTIGYALRRIGDYAPSVRRICRWLERTIGSIDAPIPINPWGDFLVIAKPDCREL